MKKKLYSIIISILLIIFSTFYTNRIVDYFRNKDQIMKEIVNYYNEYGDTKIESIFESIDNTIIPGISGKKVNI